MADQNPTVVVVAGPNGAGKSTIAPTLLPELLGVVEYVNADVIARGLSGFAPDAAALPAGKIMLAHLKELASERSSFAFEATMASRTFAPWIAGLKSSGYQFLLAYIWVNSPEISIQRVKTRVLQGGHFVPDDVVRRRYTKGLANFFKLYMPLADRWYFYDNSVLQNGILVAEGSLISQIHIRRDDIWKTAQSMAQ
jgi:predicted ABC-type ATPase